jgi:hypothetical protein
MPIDRYARAFVMAAALCCGFAASARADAAAWHGRLSIGYGKLFITDGPGGGFSTLGGIDMPLDRQLRIGPEVGYHLLGTRSVERGSSNANIDYSMLEIGVQLHWLPEHAGILHRVSFGPAMIGALADISASSAGILFEDLARSGMRPGLAFDLALAPPGTHTVTVGLEAGTRTAFLKSESWTAATFRLLLEY